MPIPAKMLIVATGVISSLASLGGGLLLYFEGLALLEKTVEELSVSDRQAVTSMLQGTFEQTIWAAEHFSDVVTRWDALSDETTYNSWVETTLMSFTHRSGVYGVGVVAAPLVNPLTNRTSRYSYSWYDVLSDGSRDYVYGHYDESQWKHPSCKGGERCVATYSVNMTTGKRRANVYNYTETLSLALNTVYLEKMEGWENGTAEWWRVPSVWYAYDGTPSMYLTYMKVLPAMDTALFRGYKVSVQTLLLLTDWQKVLDDQNTEASLVIVLYGKDNYVLATNMGLTLAKKGCTNDGATMKPGVAHPCISQVEDLPSAERKGTITLNGTAEGRFIESDGMWLVRKVVYSPRQGKDDFDAVHLLWMRPTSTIEDQLTRALILFIVFVLVVFVFDFAAGVAEVVLIARPLQQLSKATVPLQDLDLDAVDESLGQGRTVITEIAEVYEGMRFVTAALREYKSYIPDVLKGLQNDEEGDDGDSTCHGTASCPKGTSKGSRGSGSGSTVLGAQRQAKLAVQVHEVTAAVGVLELAGEWKSGTKVVESHTEWLEGVQELQGRFQGTIVRVAGMRVVVAWNASVRTTSPIAKAARLALSTTEVRGHTVSVGIASGRQFAGNMGTSTLRVFNLVGCVERRADALCTLNGTLKTRVVGDGVVASYLGDDANFVSRQIDFVVWPKELGGREEVVCEVVGEQQNGEEEWMYEVESRGVKSKDLRIVWALVMETPCDYPTALKTLRSIAGNDAALHALAERIERAAAKSSSTKYRNVITLLKSET